MRSRTARRSVITVVLGVVVLVGLYAGWLVWQVGKDLTAAADDAQALKAAAQAGDDATTRDALDALRTHSAGAADRVESPVWSLMTKVPFFGDDARGVRVVSDVVSDLAHNGIGDLVETATDLESLLPTNGRIDLARVESLQAPVAQGREALESAEERLAGEDPTGFVSRLKVEYRDLQSQISEAADVMAIADRTAQVLPPMLGSDGPKRYVLVIQNNAEIRATGGLPGAVSVIETDGGAVAMTQQIAGNSIPEQPKPLIPVTKEEQRVYGDHLWAWFLDANMTPDFPRTAELMRAHWELAQDPIDGILSLDPVTLSYILEATGPVQVRDVTLSSDTAVDELLHQVYLRYPDPADQDVYFREVAQVIFQKVASGGASPTALMRALVKGTDEHRVYVHSFDESVQADLAGTPIAGEVPDEATDRPDVIVTMNDGTGAKMSYFLRYDVEVDATSCINGVQGLTAKVHLRSDAPADAATLPDYVTGGEDYGIPRGAQLVGVRIYSPIGGDITDLKINGQPEEDAFNMDERGRKVQKLYVAMNPGDNVDLEWKLATGPDQTGSTDVTVTPSVVSGTSSSTAGSAC